MNSGGIRCVEYNVLVKQDDVEEKTKGGIYIPNERQERDKHAQTRGVLVDVSPMAFKFDDWPSGVTVPKPGDTVIFARHAGTFVDGNDGVEYRVIKDKDVVAVIDV